MLRTVRPWQHVIVGLSILCMTLLAGFGVIGAGDESLLRPEHFDAKQVTIWPDGTGGVRIREVVDIDFGPTARHGYERSVRNDYGAPIDVTASSPDADATVDAVDLGYETRIRLGDPYTTTTGRHRYVLEYTLPDAQLDDGVLALDVIGTDETFETERFEVVLTGFDLDGASCHTGDTGTFGGCEFVRQDDGNLVAVIEPLEPGAGITVDGTLAGLVTPNLPELPDQPSPVEFRLHPLGLVMLVLGVGAAATVFFVGRRVGSNDVAGGGAADAAFGDLPLPGAGRAPADVATYRVPDSRLAEMATIEFAPPRGIEPWQAAVVLNESIDERTVIAWFSEMIASDAIVVDEAADDTVTLRRGGAVNRLHAVDQRLIDELFADGDVELGAYDKHFAQTWSAIQREQRAFVRNAGWWTRGGPGAGGGAGCLITLAVVAVVVVALTVFVFWIVAAGQMPWRVLTSVPVALAAGFLVPLGTALLAYWRMFASRSATGSALALRSESFRRFLASSEGRHVQWAWENGLLREYSAWAVALGAADAWTAAIRSSNIPEPNVALAGPLAVYAHSSAFASARTAPTSSGGGGGGGVGGGGGGGSSGSW